MRQLWWPASGAKDEPTYEPLKKGWQCRCYFESTISPTIFLSISRLPHTHLSRSKSVSHFLNTQHLIKRCLLLRCFIRLSINAGRAETVRPGPRVSLRSSLTANLKQALLNRLDSNEKPPPYTSEIIASADEFWMLKIYGQAFFTWSESDQTESYGILWINKTASSANHRFQFWPLKVSSNVCIQKKISKVLSCSRGPQRIQIERNRSNWTSASLNYFFFESLLTSAR